MARRARRQQSSAGATAAAQLSSPATSDAEEQAEAKEEAAQLSYPRTIEHCPGAEGARRYAAADAEGTYDATRARGWHDANDSAVGPTGDAPAAQVAQTLAARQSLAGCTRGIVAPVPSAFSQSAAIVADVPLVPCCADLHEAERRRARRASRGRLASAAPYFCWVGVLIHAVRWFL